MMILPASAPVSAPACEDVPHPDEFVEITDALLFAEIEKESQDSRFLEQVEKILGTAFLPCKHCGKGVKPLTDFLEGLTKNFKDGQLKKVPKTCDRMRAYNAKKNKINNPIYNTKMSIKRCMDRVEPADLLAVEDTVVVTKLPKLHEKLNNAITHKSLVVSTEKLAQEMGV